VVLIAFARKSAKVDQLLRVQYSCLKIIRRYAFESTMPSQPHHLRSPSSAAFRADRKLYLGATVVPGLGRRAGPGRQDRWT
jgi:hypothetical protein